MAKQDSSSPLAPQTSDAETAIDGLPPLRAIIQRDGLRAKKSLSQNFLFDLNLTRKIARQCGDLTGRTVVEIGPGPGGLTRALLMEGAQHVMVVERDERCRTALEEIAAHWPGQVHILQADALETDLNAALEALQLKSEHKPIIAANLPYGIATKLLTNWVTEPSWLPWYERMVLMFQKEVADRIVAAEGSRTYGRLSVLAQWRCHCDIAMQLKADAFVPPPKVSSAIVRLVPRNPIGENVPARALERVTQACFGQRRKMLRVCVRQLTDTPDAFLEAVGLDGQRRAETLTVAEFVRIAAVWNGQQSGTS